MLSPEQERLRQSLKVSVNERKICLKDLADIASDTTYTGFEDPRAAATDRIEHSYKQCERDECDAEVKIGPYDDDYTFIGGVCQKFRICAREVELKEGYLDLPKLEERRSNEQLGYLCTKSECGYSFGWTIDGAAGNSGTCIKNSPL